MEENTSSPDEINSKKKRKSEDEHLEMTSPKHLCCGQNVARNNSPPNTNAKPNKVESENFAREGDQSDPESAKDSNSIDHINEDSIISTDEDDEANTTDIEYPEMCGTASDEPSTSSVSWSGTTSSSDIGLYSSEGTSLTKSSSVNKQFDCSCLEWRQDGIEPCADKGLDNLLYSNGVANGDYVLSSGRWSVNRDTRQQEGKKLTIDKEFEQYFSMLML